MDSICFCLLLLFVCFFVSFMLFSFFLIVCCFLSFFACLFVSFCFFLCVVLYGRAFGCLLFFLGAHLVYTSK